VDTGALLGARQRGSGAIRSPRCSANFASGLELYFCLPSVPAFTAIVAAAATAATTTTTTTSSSSSSSSSAAVLFYSLLLCHRHIESRLIIIVINKQYTQTEKLQQIGQI